MDGFISLADVPCFTVPVAAHAARLPERNLRAWLDRHPSMLIGVQQSRPGSARLLCPVDVVRMAVFGRMTAFGFRLVEAARLIDDHLSVAMPAATPWPLLCGSLNGIVLRIQRDGAEISAGAGRDSMPFNPSFTTLELDVGAIASDAHERVREVTRKVLIP